MAFDTKFKEALKAVKMITLDQDIAKKADMSEPKKGDQDEVPTGSWSRQVHS